MGLCKCRVVTTLFCFQHRVNVCENCLVSEHPTVREDWKTSKNVLRLPCLGSACYRLTSPNLLG
eukprot:m.141650 g.141650  ORF g.141650 m.141650 type:complete len:64 (+) comp17124_c0_seq2:192-383(+)